MWEDIVKNECIGNKKLFLLLIFCNWQKTKTTIKMEINKIVFRFWGSNLLISIILFVIYRILISQTKLIDGSSFEKWMQILELILNLGFSLVYLVAMLISSFALLLNLIKKIRISFYLSLFTFLGLPAFCVIFIVITLLIDICTNDLTVLTTLAIFSIIYLFLTTMQFLWFRKRINKVELNN